MRVDRPVSHRDAEGESSAQAAVRPTSRHQVTRPDRSVRKARVPAVPGLALRGRATVRQPVLPSTRQAPRRSALGDQQAAGPADEPTQVGYAGAPAGRTPETRSGLQVRVNGLRSVQAVRAPRSPGSQRQKAIAPCWVATNARPSSLPHDTPRGW